MKTPREILLARHRAAEPELNRIRREVVEEVDNKATKDQSGIGDFVSWCLCGSRTLGRKLWLELIWPARQTWAGLAAVWLVLLSFNFAMREPAPVSEARRETPASSQLKGMLQLREQMLAQLAGPIEKLELIRPRLPVPQPRSQRRDVFMNA